MTTFQNYPIPADDAAPDTELGTPWRPTEDAAPACVVLAIRQEAGALALDYVVPPPGSTREHCRQSLDAIIQQGWDDDYDDILRVNPDELVVVKHGVWAGDRVTRIVVAEHVATTH